MVEHTLNFPERATGKNNPGSSQGRRQEIGRTLHVAALSTQRRKNSYCRRISRSLTAPTKIAYGILASRQGRGPNF